MENQNSYTVIKQIVELCQKYQEERVSGLWYINQTGLNKIAKVLGGDYKKLTKKQKAIFRTDCVSQILDKKDVKTWWYYINL